jgi:hypothetical protein
VLTCFFPGLNSVVPEASLQEADDGMTLKQLGVKGQAAGDKMLIINNSC